MIELMSNQYAQPLRVKERTSDLLNSTGIQRRHRRLNSSGEDVVEGRYEEEYEFAKADNDQAQLAEEIIPGKMK